MIIKFELFYRFMVENYHATSVILVENNWLNGIYKYIFNKKYWFYKFI